MSCHPHSLHFRDLERKARRGEKRRALVEGGAGGVSVEGDIEHRERSGVTSDFVRGSNKDRRDIGHSVFLK